MILVVAIVVALLVEPPLSWAVLAAGILLEVGETAFWWKYTHRRHASVGVETIVGRPGVAISELAPDGQVRVDGEIWKARSGVRCERGTHVVVREVDGLTLVVEPR